MATFKRASRRDFLHATTAIALASAIGLTNRQATPVSPEPETRHHLALLRGRTGAIIIGRRYLSLYPQQAEPALLQSLVRADLATHRGDLTALIKDDFRTGRTLQADGWALSLTEARLCALANLPNTA